MIHITKAVELIKSIKLSDPKIRSVKFVPDTSLNAKHITVEEMFTDIIFNHIKDYGIDFNCNKSKNIKYLFELK